MNGQVLRLCVHLVALNCYFVAGAVSAADAVASVPVTYESHVRPILKTHCFHCHGEGGRIEGGLDMRLRRLIVAGGDSGEVLVAGQPQASLLAHRIRSGEMPPEEVTARLTAQEMDTLEAWIAQGAVGTQEEPAHLNPDRYITEQERGYWAFQPIIRPRPPAVLDRQQAANPIDQFILARLRPVGLSHSPRADRATLIRRITYALLGLPPTPTEVQEFIDDPSAQAYERLIDRLLSSPHYGEHWGQHWLDVAGYADSEGYTEDDPQRPHAFHYRDYVIQAINRDKPFDEFIIEQLAGDELITPPFNNLTPNQAEKLIATGFLRMAPDGTGISGVDQDAARNDVIAKTIEIVSTSLMGLTVGCAQCHNHRYDPILQEDYYAMRAIFEPALDWKNWKSPEQRHLSLYTDADRALAATIEAEAQQVLDQRTAQEKAAVERIFEAELAKLTPQLQTAVREARGVSEKERTADQKKLLGEHPSVNVTASSLYLYDKPAADALKKLSDEAAAIRSRKPQEEFVRAIWEPVDTYPQPTYLFHRGDHEQPKQTVPPRTLTVLTSAKAAAAQAPEIMVDDPSLPTTGRRLAFAKWLTSSEHPLVARVIVNRIWLNHFGRGLVPTPGDFGSLGEAPTHPELLDWLAAELMSSGWSVKHLQRLILTSATYQQSSLQHTQGNALDRDNLLYWRMPLRRLEAEVVRDSTLAISGEFIARAFGPPIPIMPDRVGQFVIGIENTNAGRPGDIIPMHGEDLRRSIYVESRRSRPLSILAPFDLPRMEPNCTARSVSTVSPQSLLLMNSDFMVTRGMRMAERLQREAGDDLTAQIRLAWRLSFSNEPNADEINQALQFVNQQRLHFVADPFPSMKDQATPSPATEAMGSFCHALLSSNRFLYVD